MLRLLFVFAIIGVGVVGAFRSRFAALLLYVWFALFRPQEWLWIDITRYRPSLMLGLLLVVPALLTGVFPVIAHPLSIGMLVFLGAAFGSQPGAVNQPIGWYWLDFISKLVLVSLFAIRLASTRARLMVLIALMAFSFGFHPIKAGLVSIVGGGLRFMGGMGGAFVDNNAYALGTVMILPFLIAIAQNASRRWVKWGASLSVPLAAFTVISTFSRAGFLALGACACTWILLQRRKMVLLATTALVLPLLVLLAPMPSGYSERIATIGTYAEVEDDSALSRLHFWRVALVMSADRPLGIGLWNFESDYDRYDTLEGRYGRRRAVHSSHLQALTETGWLGGAAWVVLFVIAFRRTFRARADSKQLGANGRFVLNAANALIASMAAFVIGGTFISMALNDLTWLTFALAASLDRIVRQELSQAAKAGEAAAGRELPASIVGWQPPERGYRLS